MGDIKYTIESDIPPPKVNVQKGEWVKLARGMKIGDSVQVQNTTEANSLYRAIERLGYISRTKKIKGCIRVWKLKKV